MNSKTIAKDSTEEASILRLELERKQKEIKILEDKIRTNEKADQRSEKLMHSLVEAAAGKTGQDFFDNIVLRLSEWLGAECVLIGRMVENERIKAVPLYLDGKISQDFSYDLAGSPCDIIIRKGYCEFDKDVINLFPKDKILVDLSAEGYIGTALYNKEGEANGVICTVSRKKLIIPSYAKDILKIIWARVSAEIERLKTEEDLKQSEAELKESNATKDKLFSIIAHDLKSPFNLILGFSDLLTKNAGKYDAAKQKKMIEAIHQATKNAHALLENLLT